MAEYFQNLEDTDGTRWTWHTFPNKTSGKEKSSGGCFSPEMVVPLACVITPLKNIPTVPVIQGVPTKCRQCSAIASRFCKVDPTSRSWTCPFCRSRNDQGGSSATLQLEFGSSSSTVEYILNKPQAPSPVFIFVVDIATKLTELNGEKDAILGVIPTLPPDSLIGVITVGKNVTVWELGFKHAVKGVVFTGDPKSGEYSQEAVRDFLGIKKGSKLGPSEGVAGRYLIPAADCEQIVTNLFDDLTQDPWPVPQGRRALRSTGAAMEISTAIAELLIGPGKDPFHGRIILLLSGPCPRGPGSMVTDKLEETLRSHSDIKDGNAPHLSKATEFGKKLAKRLRKINFCIDMFMISLDQVGLLELSEAIVYTGGYIISSDTFHAPVFITSFEKLFKKIESRNNVLNMFFNVTIEVQTSAETKIAGCIGPCRGIDEMSQSASASVEVGDGKTCAWSTSSIDTTTSFSVVFDAEKQSGSPNRYTQFLTAFTDSHGSRRLRVTTQMHAIASSADRDVINATYCFDQLAAASVLGRMTTRYMEENSNDMRPIVRWLDRSLINFVKKFSTYQSGDPKSLHLPQQYSLLPQFMYHLRRSEFLQVFNSSADETVFFRNCLSRETVPQAVAMIQPSLKAYDYGMAVPHPVQLDSESVRPDNILLCDAYFDVTIHHGKTIAEWRKNGYQDQPGYEAFKAQLEAPHVHMAEIVESRFPSPKITICDQYTSQARYVLSKINPSDTKLENVEDGVQVCQLTN